MSLPGYQIEVAGAEERLGRIDVFGPDGEFLAELAFGPKEHPCSLGVDSLGDLYVLTDIDSVKKVLLFEPNAFPPAEGIDFGQPRTVTTSEEEVGGEARVESLAVDPSNGHLYVSRSTTPERKPDRIEEFDSAADGSGLLDANLAGEIPTSGSAEPNYPSLSGISVYGPNHNLYITGDAPRGEADAETGRRVFVLDGTTHALTCEATGQETLAGNFQGGRGLALAVDQANGDFYISDASHHLIDQFNASCQFIDQLPIPPSLKEGNFAFPTSNALAVDDPVQAGEAGYRSPNPGYLYAASGDEKASKSHLFAYRPSSSHPPAIEAQHADEITETEARLRAKINPGNLDTNYYFEYLSEKEFTGNGASFAGAARSPIPAADAGEGGAFTEVSVAVAGLSAGTVYRFRLVAKNEACPPDKATAGEGVPCGEGKAATFSTFATPPSSGPCPNEDLRIGPSTSLPDCRAYELVTPPETGGLIPTMTDLGRGASAGGILFATRLASPGGSILTFGVEGGTLAEFSGGGYHDTYTATRLSGSGWQTSFTGISPSEATLPDPGGISPDQHFALWHAEGAGSLPTGSYLRTPDGVEPIGVGSNGTDIHAVGDWIGEGGRQIVFDSSLHLEEDAAPSRTGSVYERSAPDGLTRVVSLRPDGSSFGPAENASYRGISADGRAIAFSVGEALYVRIDADRTLEAVLGSEAVFGGLAQAGESLVYLRPNPSEPQIKGTQVDQGQIFECRLSEGPCAGSGKSHEPTMIGSGERSVLVNVSADGSHVYFVSPEALDKAGEGIEGKENLYLWDRETESLRLVAIVTERDLLGTQESSDCSPCFVDGLGLWARSLETSKSALAGPGTDPSRTTPKGNVLVFQSRAKLTAQDNAGLVEVYRYDAEESGPPICISCGSTGLSPASGAELQSIPAKRFESSLPPTNDLVEIDNLSSEGNREGNRVFYQSSEQLVSADRDSLQDVYEWEASGTGGCEREAGCIVLISGGRSAHPDYLYALTPDGRDVFIESADPLVPSDPGSTYSIYDARIGGGFPEGAPPPAECLGEACQPLAGVPVDPTPSSSTFYGAGNRVPHGSCAALTRRARLLSARADRLRRQLQDNTKARRMRVKARHLEQRAQHLAKQARHCLRLEPEVAR